MKKMLLAGIVAVAAGVAGQAMAEPGYGPGPGSSGYYPAPPTRYMGPRYGQRQAPADATDENPGPGALLRSGVDKLLAFVSQSPMPDRLKIAAFLEEEISPFFDFTYMARVAAGPAMRDMTEEQQQRLSGRLKEMFLGALAERLSDYDQQQVIYLPPRGTRGKVVTLSVAIQQAGPYPAQLDFRLHRTAEGWKVFDVAANGSSALAYYRDYFRRAMMPKPSGPYGGMYN